MNKKKMLYVLYKVHYWNQCLWPEEDDIMSHSEKKFDWIKGNDLETFFDLKKWFFKMK